MKQLLFSHMLPFLAALASQSCVQAPASGSTVVLENDRVRIERVQLAPSSRSNRQSIAQDSLAVALDPGTLEVSSAGEPAASGEVRPAKTWWWPKAPATHSIANAGKKPYVIVKISLK